jgi:hypothetical protein
MSTTERSERVGLFRPARSAHLSRDVSAVVFCVVILDQKGKQSKIAPKSFVYYRPDQRCWLMLCLFLAWIISSVGACSTEFPNAAPVHLTLGRRLK